MDRRLAKDGRTARGDGWNERDERAGRRSWWGRPERTAELGNLAEGVSRLGGGGGGGAGGGANGPPWGMDVAISHRVEARSMTRGGVYPARG